MEPADTPVTTPNEFTVATDVFEEVHVTVLFVALDGTIVAVNCLVEPVFIVVNVGIIVTDVTGTVMVNIQMAVRLPLTVVARIVALPAETLVTIPDELTVALAEVELHVTVLSVALDGVIVGVNASVLVG